MKFAIVILAAFALLLAGCASAPSQPAGAPPAAVPPAPGNNASPPALPPSGGNTVISVAQLATHNTAADCWVGYDGQVYDITAFIPNHKNYQALIVPLCGSSDQFKARFEGKHGLSKVNMLEAQPLMGALGQ